ncbi:GNAT family N-acetyltransferase [Candidatus Fermentibacterales bacterium]|nr:GNAT family N-acetyltransferase [Candidatus Fermentibacterales bacterium]
MLMEAHSSREAPEAFRLRQAEAADFEGLRSLWALFEGTTMTGVDSPGGFGLFLGRNPGMSFVAVESEGDRSERCRIVGSVLGGHDARRGYVYHLAVHPDFQDLGIARRLMELVESAFSEAGLEKAHLFVYTDNPAIGFYERIGWHLRSDIHVMSKLLDGDADPAHPPPEAGERGHAGSNTERGRS